MTSKYYTAAIIGGGPAGCQCALWLKMMGMHPVIIESSNHLGGLQLLSPYQNQWIAGLMDVSGREFAARIQAHLQSKDVPVLFNSEVISCKQSAEGFTLITAAAPISARFVVIATGSVQRYQSGKGAANQAEHDAAFANQVIEPAEGWQSNLPKAFDGLKDQLLNDDGFIQTNAACETPIPGIYAIGEAANRMHPCVVTSMADGVVAAKSIQASS